VEHKPLEKIRGFLNYVMQVYPAMIPYLRGFHGTLDSWRTNRTADGFDKRVNSELEPEQGVAKQPQAKRQKTSHSSDPADRDVESEEIGFDGAAYTDPKVGLGNDDEDSEAEEPSSQPSVGGKGVPDSGNQRSWSNRFRNSDKA